MEILVFGSAIVDLICYVDRLPKAGETLHGNKFSTGFGGKGANQCVAAARLGAKTAMVAKLGDDSWGRNYLANFRKECIGVKYVECCKNESTGIAQISVSNTGENHIVIVPGANNLLSDDDVKCAKKLFDIAKILVCQLEVPVEATLFALENFNGFSILNAAPAIANISRDLLKAASIFCVNETEAAIITGCEEISTLQESKNAVKKMLALGARMVILTLGPLGAVYNESNEDNKIVHVSAPAVENVVDTTGAGDSFIGSLAFLLSRYPSWPTHRQIGAACKIAAHTVKFPGTQTSYPHLSEIKSVLNEEFEWNII